MSSGTFPLVVKWSPVGQQLAQKIDELRAIKESREFPSAWANDNAEDGAADGRYEAYIDLALELLERCIERPKP